ncbi:MAG: carbonic anhydrase, partial [Snowella sp.]
ATRRLIKENYGNLHGEELLEITVAENILNQLENLHTYPVIRSKLHQGKLALHGWIYRIETGEVLEYDSIKHDFVAPQSRLPAPEYEYNWHPSCSVPGKTPLAIPHAATLCEPEAAVVIDNSHLPGYSHLSHEQSERIYRGSK